ncbi:hypothetical protein R5R35_006225 [Gryllus longicercus]|uniref:Uncharacterized protein n=1 Tax=Gryllus longicercus TaxID=2509291 RepID=A0AAN9WTJ1_9ORTH
MSAVCASRNNAQRVRLTWTLQKESYRGATAARDTSVQDGRSTKTVHTARSAARSTSAQQGDKTKTEVFPRCSAARRARLRRRRVVCNEIFQEVKRAAGRLLA